jgi:uncharacterized protein (TIGR03032 family)
MSTAAPTRRASPWRRHDAAWRDPAQVIAQCEQAIPVAPELLRCEVYGEWWGVLERLDACLVISREYEHLLLALAVTSEGPRRSFMALPHPSGLAFDISTDLLHVASTRNPNQLYLLAPASGGAASGGAANDSVANDSTASGGAANDSVANDSTASGGAANDSVANDSTASGGAANDSVANDSTANDMNADGGDCDGMNGDGGDGDSMDHERPLVPLSMSFLPGRLYLHDLALVEGSLHGNAVGINAIVRFTEAGAYEVVWWPRSIERRGHPDLTRNYLQLNSIAAGTDLSSSFFSASAAAPSARRPGHRNFPVEGRGVIFSGATREPVARGLTRPHSARLHGGELWVDDSGYGRVGVVREGRLEPVSQLPGWTRGLAFAEDVAFVGTSRVIPRFAHYAPGLDVRHSVCGVHALDSSSGERLGGIVWPAGNQIFDIAVLPRARTHGFPALAGRRQRRRALESFFFSYRVPKPQESNE